MTSTRTAGSDLYRLFEAAGDLMPPATRVSIDSGTAAVTDARQLESAVIGRFVVTYYPHYTVWLLRPVSFEFKISMAFPATPPVVRCLDEMFISEFAERANLDTSGKPQLSILTTESLGWMKSYTLADVIHCVRRCLMKDGLVVHNINNTPPYTPSCAPELPLHVSSSVARTPHRNSLPGLLGETASEASAPSSPTANGFSFGTISHFAFPVSTGSRNRTSSVTSPTSSMPSSHPPLAPRRSSSFRLAKEISTPERSVVTEADETPASPRQVEVSPAARPPLKRRSSQSTLNALGLAGFAGNMNGAGAMLGSSTTATAAPRPSSATLMPLRQLSSFTPRGNTLPRHPLVRIVTGHAGLVGRRPTMEDAAVFINSVNVAKKSDFTDSGDQEGSTDASSSNTPLTVAYIGIYDGHGGSRASEFVAQTLHNEILSALDGGCTVAEAMHSAYLSVDQEFEQHLSQLQQAAAAAQRDRFDSDVAGSSSCLTPHLSPVLGSSFDSASGFVVPSAPAQSQQPQSFATGAGFNGIGRGFLGDFDNPDAIDDQSGSTAISVVVAGNPSDGGTVTVANAGDSRAVLSRAGDAVALSFDHKAKRQDERARILTAGGMIIRGRVLGRLAVTRAIGDLSLKRGAGSNYLVTAEPEIFEIPLAPADEFIIVACDGIWDVMENQDAVVFVRRLLSSGVSCEEAARRLAKKAFDMNSADNLSVVVAIIGDGPPISGTPTDAEPAAAEPVNSPIADDEVLEKLLAQATGPSRYSATTSSSAVAEEAAPKPVPEAPSKKKDRGPNPFARSTRRALGEHVTEKAVPDGPGIADAPSQPPIVLEEETRDTPTSTTTAAVAPAYGRRAHSVRAAGEEPAGAASEGTGAPMQGTE